MKQTALVTGASSGLGSAFCRLFAEKGYDLVMAARREDLLIKGKKELEEKYGIHVHVFSCDLTDPESPDRLYAFTGGQKIQVDVLVNNAGFGAIGRFTELDWKKQDDMTKIFITAQMRLQYLYLPDMVRAGYGKVLNVSSISAFCAGPNMAVYYASKEYIRCFTEALAEELRGTGVTLTALCFGPTDTGFEKAMGQGKTRMFSGKLMTAEHVAESGYQAMMKGKVLAYCGAQTKGMNLLSRILPRSVMRKGAAGMNK